MTRKNLIAAALLVFGAAGFFFYGRGAVSSAEAQYVYEGEPEILAATFASAWCSACKILEPRLARVVPAFADRPVRFIEFDFTFGEKPAHAALASEHGFSSVYERFRSGTGFTLLIDAETGDVVDTLTINHSEGAMRAAIAAAIAFASKPGGGAEDEAI